MPEVYVGIGSNIERGANVRAALEAMAGRFGPLRQSPVYETEPVGFDGPNFYNLVVGFGTREPLSSVEEALAAIETERGRRRNGDGFNDRALDLDVLLYGDVVDHDGRDVPRADVLAYAFVLQPLAELAPALVHPECGRTFGELWAAFDDCGQKLWRVMPPPAAEPVAASNP